MNVIITDYQGFLRHCSRLSHCVSCVYRLRFWQWSRVCLHRAARRGHLSVPRDEVTVGCNVLLGSSAPALSIAAALMCSVPPGRRAGTLGLFAIEKAAKEMHRSVFRPALGSAVYRTRQVLLYSDPPVHQRTAQRRSTPSARSPARTSTRRSPSRSGPPGSSRRGICPRPGSATASACTSRRRSATRRCSQHLPTGG